LVDGGSAVANRPHGELLDLPCAMQAQISHDISGD
jgi:hypothetical protein